MKLAAPCQVDNWKNKNGGRSLTDVILFIEEENYDRKKEKNKEMIKNFSKSIIDLIGEKIDLKKEELKQQKLKQQKVF